HRPPKLIGQLVLMIAHLLRNFAALFVVTPSRGSVERLAGLRTSWLLAIIVLAGTIVRFWGLGSVGLHGDEKTMALPVMNLVNQGLPLMPSGMFYPRAVGQLYLMAASIMAFGQSEWAMRVPSALCGVLLIVLMWNVGKRFLTPVWNLALTAAVAFLPSFIDDAQTARMYVFLVTCVAAYMSLVFAWERSGRLGYLIAAVVTLYVGLQFHTLSIFASFLVLLPGLLQGDVRKFRAGVIAFAIIVVGFGLIDHLISLAYPQSVESEAGAVSNGPHATFVPHVKHLWLLLGALPALGFSFWVLGRRGILAPLLLAAALVAEIALAWHAAVLLAVAALVLARRIDVLSRPRLAVFVVVSSAIVISQAVFLVEHHAGSLKQIAGVMLGWPSVWPFIAIADYSAIAMLAVTGALASGLWLLARRKPVPDHVLLTVMGVWVPLLMIGWIKWNIPPRYAAAQIVPMLVAGFAALQWGTQWLAQRLGSAMAPAPVAAAAVLAVLLVINPVRVARTVDSGYTNHPDHKGAAEYVAHLHPGPHDIIIAEDVLQQTYYLGHVDYWLVNKQVAAPFMHQVNGRWLDFYTDTPLIGTGPELERLVEKPDRGAIYVIGSGEDQGDGRGLMRAFGISQTLSSPAFRTVYLGRDGLTRVWKVDAPSPTVAKGR
ncbi:MAG TPA: glycosyltransferase family 39 protein, partial [Steroidobacteraceae bacterium]